MAPDRQLVYNSWQKTTPIKNEPQDKEHRTILSADMQKRGVAPLRDIDDNSYEGSPQTTGFARVSLSLLLVLAEAKINDLEQKRLS